MSEAQAGGLWQPLATVPPGTEVEVKIGCMIFRARYMLGASLTGTGVRATSGRRPARASIPCAGRRARAGRATRTMRRVCSRRRGGRSGVAMPDVPPPPTGTLDARVEDGRLTVIVYGPNGPATVRISQEATRALYRMLGRNLEPERFDSHS